MNIFSHIKKKIFSKLKKKVCNILEDTWLMSLEQKNLFEYIKKHTNNWDWDMKPQKFNLYWRLQVKASMK